MKKNKRLNPQETAPKKTKPGSKDKNEEISSDDDEELPKRNGYAEAAEMEEEFPETAQEKKLRLAKKYLEEIERQGTVYIHPDANQNAYSISKYEPSFQLVLYLTSMQGRSQKISKKGGFAIMRVVEGGSTESNPETPLFSTPLLTTSRLY